MARPHLITDVTLEAMLAAGHSNQKIAEFSGLKMETVQKRIRRIAKTPSGQTSLAVRKSMRGPRDEAMRVIAAIPDDPTPVQLHRLARRALAVAASAEGTQESVVAAKVILDKVELPPAVVAQPSEDLIKVALAASASAAAAAAEERDEGAIDATAREANEDECAKPAAKELLQ